MFSKWSGAVALAAAVTSSSTTWAKQSGTIEVQCNGLARSAGEVVCALYDSEESFPSEDKVFAASYARVDGPSVTCRFDGVPRGRYAVAMFHDEDGDRKLKTFLGMPREGYGFSNDAPPSRFGPPKFSQAAFDFDGDSKRIVINVKYP